MKLKHLFSSILFITISTNAVAQKIETSITWLTNIPDPANNISYNPKQKLAIDDFKGSTAASTDAVAVTASGFMFTAGYHSKGEKATLSIAVYCSFNKKESWMKEKGKTPYILLHEQHHFDISYLNTLLFIKKIKQTKFRQHEYKEQLKEVYQDVIDKMEAMQHRYDNETQNGINIEKQAEWNKKIEELLSAASDENIL